MTDLIEPGGADDATRLAWFEALYRRNAFGIMFGEGDQITAANDALIALIGWTREEFEATPPTWRTITPGAGTAEDEAANAQAIATGTWVPIERTWRRRDGSSVPVLIGGTVYDRERFRWVAYAFDISRQREAEQALARSEERFALAVRGSSDGIWDWDLVRDEVFLSARAASILGMGDDDLVEAGAATHARLHPEDAAEWRARMRAHFKARTPYRQEFRMRRADGGWQWVRARGEATFVGDRAVRMAGTVTDIQSRKEAEVRLVESERRLTLAMRATSDGVIDFVVGQDHVWCSARTAAILELSEIPDGGVVSWARAIVGQAADEVERQQAALDRCLATGTTYDVTIARERLDGTTQWLRVRGFPDRSGAGDEVRFVASISDITADVIAQAALRASEARVWQAQKMDALGTLSSGIAHDFNNLLAVILGYVEVGLAGQPTGLAERALTEIGVAGRRARELVGRLLSFSRHEPPAAMESLARTAVEDAVRETLALLEGTCPANVHVARTVAPGLPAVAMDEGTLPQALLNLAVNALHAMRGTGGTLTIGAGEVVASAPFDGGSRELPAGRYVRVFVADTGTGIPAELLDRVAEPFFTTKAHGEGTGLGLSVVHGLVTSAGGAMRISSAVGAGTTVDLLLPAAEGAASHRPADAEPAAALPADDVAGRHVLIVDDDVAVAEMMAHRLAALGCHTTLRHGAEAALECLEGLREPVQLVLADWTMPGHTGDWLAERVTAQWPDVPVVVMTGSRHGDLAARALAAGAAMVLEKPVETDDLLAMLRRVSLPGEAKRRQDRGA